MTYLSVLRRLALTPGTVSTSPSKEAEIWNSLKRQAMTHPVVALERPTWSLTMIGVLMLLPTRVLMMMSKSDSRGAPELQIGTLMCTSPGYFSLSFSMLALSVLMSLTSISLAALLMSTYLSLHPFSSALALQVLRKLTSCSLTESLVTFPSSACSPILFGGLAQRGSPLTYTLGSCLMLNQMIPDLQTRLESMLSLEM